MSTTDRAVCSACDREDRASEGYPCEQCGRFICLPCALRGIVRCRVCDPTLSTAPTAPPPPGPRIRGV
jgi:hypothetical protein